MDCGSMTAFTCCWSSNEYSVEHVDSKFNTLSCISPNIYCLPTASYFATSYAFVKGEDWSPPADTIWSQQHHPVIYSFWVFGTRRLLFGSSVIHWFVSTRWSLVLFCLADQEIIICPHEWNAQGIQGRSIARCMQDPLAQISQKHENEFVVVCVRNNSHAFEASHELGQLLWPLMWSLS